MSAPYERTDQDDLLARGLPSPALRRVTAVLCLTEITSWGTLYYAFPVLAPSIAAETGWSSTSVVAAFTLSLVVSALAGLAVGRRIHRLGPHAVMTAGSVTAVAGLLLVARSPTLWFFFVAWTVAGASMAAVLYPPAFAALTGWAGADEDRAERRVRALTALTLMAGLASTVFAPLAAFLVGPLGWRDTYLVLAAVLAIAIPLHGWGLRPRWPIPPPSPDLAQVRVRGQGPHQAAAPTWRTKPFVLLVLSLSAVGLCIWSLVILFVPLLTERGISTQAAAIALGLGGVGQVVGRLGHRRLSAYTSLRRRTQLVFAAVAATTLGLAVVTGPYVLLVLLSVLAGAARGIYTLIQATAVSDRWGVAGYARLNAVASVPLLLTSALAPWVATAASAAVGSRATTLGLLAALSLLAAAAVPVETRRPKSDVRHAGGTARRPL